MPPPKCAIPIIAMTANAMSGAEQEYLDAGMDDYVSKPIQVEGLFAKLSVIARAIGERSAKQDSRPEAAEDGATDPAICNFPLLDPERIESLTAVLPVSDVRDLLLLYMLDAEKYLERIRAPGAKDDLKSMTKDVHVIMGTAGNMGAAKVYAHAKALDVACRNGDEAVIAHLVDGLMAANVKTNEAIRSWIENSQSVQRSNMMPA